MKIQTFSIVIGTRACNAKCPFCVSSMTGFDELPAGNEIDLVNFNKACRMAQIGGTTTVLFTGKGEPTLYPVEINTYLDLLRPWQFPFIELQTNGLEIGRLARDGKSKIRFLDEKTLRALRMSGLNTIAISTVGIDPKLNAEIYNRDYPELERTVAYLRDLGYTVRLCVMMMHGGVSSPETLEEVIDWCRKNDVAQLKVQAIRKPKRTEDPEASEFVVDRGLAEHEISGIAGWLEDNGTPLMTLMHGAVIYDVAGQNVCLSDCLTLESSNDDVRTLIFYSDGLLTHDWQFDGAVLLSGRPKKDQPVAIGKR